MMDRSSLFTSLALFFWVLPARPASGQLLEKQWQSLGAFPHGVECVYFLDLPGPPRVGLLGDTGAVYRTTDGGANWIPVLEDSTIFPSDFTFANADTGWFANFLGDGSPLYRTTDGGSTWSALSAPAPHPSSIYYNRAKRLLLLSSWEGGPKTPGTLSASSDGGATWSVVVPNAPFNGFAFLNGDSGVVTERDNGAFRTTDGGYSWQFPSSIPAEIWQAAGDTVRRVVWGASERGTGRAPDESILYESSDFGNYYSVVENIPAITGTMREGSCGNLYLQTVQAADADRRGLLESSDGLTWAPMQDANGNAGPVNILDTRFYVRGDYVFAGGTVAGDDSIRLWRYVDDSTKFGDTPFRVPYLSTNNFHIVSSTCLGLDSAVYLVYYNDCLPAFLISARLADTSRFALLLQDTLPHQASGYYPITIAHRPQGRSSDSSELYIHVYANGQDIFDTVQVSAVVLGAQIAAPFNIVVNGTMDAVLRGGDSATVTIRLTDSLPASLDLNSIAFAMNYDSNVLSFHSAQAVSPWLLTRQSDSAGITYLELAPPAGASALPDTAIAHIFYTANVAPASSTGYTLSDLRLNGVSFQACAGTASLPAPASITVLGCGDTILRDAMAQLPIAELLGIETSGQGATLTLRSTAPMGLHIELYNEIGSIVESFAYRSHGGTEKIPLGTSGLESGLYIIIVRSGAVAFGSERFVIER